jgi:DNA-binding MarR family transcriptional regulator/ribosomal protein S18 acetylase RimI-like enzyme
MPGRSANLATTLVRAFSRELASAGGLLSPDYLQSGLSLPEVRCLYELGHAESLEISVLAKHLDLDVGHVSRVVSRLVARGLVSKRIEPRDARARSLVVTAKGKTRLAALDRDADRRLASWLGQKSAPAVDELVTGLRGFLGQGRSSDDRVVLRGPRPGSLGHIIARHGEIYHSEFDYPASFEGYVAVAFGEMMQDFAPPRDRIWIAERGGEFLGSISVKGRAEGTAQLRFLIVERAARGLGLGRRLVRRVIDHARAQGERRIILDTASDLDAARGLYAAQGFRKISSITEPWLPRDVQSERWELDLTGNGKVA